MIGLDGATFDVINPLIEEGLMPNLAELIDKGASGSMLSTIPPISGPAWVSLATGMKPEKTSIYDFTYRKGNSYDLQPVSSLDYAGRAVWDHLGKAGRKVGILNYPMFIPPYEVNGFISAGLWASEDGEFTFPPALKQELNEAAGGKYELDVDYHKPRYEDTELFLDDIHRVLAKKLDAAKYFVKEKEWDFFWFVISETDWIQHIMWRHIDESHPLYEGKKSRMLHQKFKEFWRVIDEAIGEMSAIAGEQSNIVVFSDHGFGPNEEIFRLNVWLEREGYLVWKKKRSKAFSSAKGVVFTCCKSAAKAVKLNKLTPGLYNHYGRKTRGRLIERAIDQIDIEKSVAFDPGHTIPFGGIYINDQLIKDPRKRDELGREIAGKLRNWGNLNNVKVETWQKCDSPVTEAGTGPDVLVGINDWRCVLPKDRFNGEVFERKPYSSRHTGSHRMDGIFIGVGPDIQSCTIDKVHIYDIAPTILYLFNMPVPQHMDGNVLKSIVDEQYLTRNPVKHQSGDQDDGFSDSIDRTKELTQKEKDVIQQQLKDLGYM